MSDILLFAAGSLRLAFTPLLSAFQRDTGQKVSAEFGPAGLLRQRIENGERRGSGTSTTPPTTCSTPRTRR